MAVFGQRVYLWSMKIMCVMNTVIWTLWYFTILCLGLQILQTLCVVNTVLWTLVFYYPVSDTGNPANFFYVHICSIITFNLL